MSIIPKTSSGEIEVGSFHNGDNLKCEIEHDRRDFAHTIKKSLTGNSIALDEETSDTMSIFLQIHRGETIALVVNCSDTIDYLKMMVHRKKGIPLEWQRIFFGVKELEVDKTLLDYGVHNRAKLYLVDRQISVMTKQITCLVKISGTIESVDCLKKKFREVIEVLEKIPLAQQRIKYAGKQLEDGHSLSYYGIQRKATFDISITPPEVVKMKIMPKTSSSSGEIDTPKVGSFHHSDNLKGEINHDRGGCAHPIKKSLAGNIALALDEKSSNTKEGESVPYPPKKGKIRECDLQRHMYGSKQIEVEIPGCNISSEPSMNIVVRTLTGKSIAFVVNCFDTTGYLKMKVCRKEGIPPDQQRIIFCGRQLEVENILLDYGVQNGAALHLVIRLRGGGSQISIMKKRITYQAKISGTVESVDSLKEKIQEHEGIRPAKQMIMYAGRVLEDGRPLTDYGLKREATVDVLFTGDDMKVIALAEIQSATRKFHNAYLIDEGGSAKVYKSVLHGKVVAIKKLKPERNETEPNETKYFGTEVAALGACEHPNIVKIIGYYMDENERINVTEYVARGSLYSLLHARSPDDAILDWNARLGIALDIASAMVYIHNKTYFIHRDLKTQNILLDENLRAKVADFGIVKSRADDDGEVRTVLIGTMGYRCPDYFMSGSVGPHVDVYAFGVILLELLSGRKALESTTRTLLADWARRLIKEDKHVDLLDPHLYGEIDGLVFKDVAELATKCVSWEKEDRPSMTHIHCKLLSIKEKHT